MTSKEINDIFAQINNLKVSVSDAAEAKKSVSNQPKESMRDLLNSISEEIQRVLDENNLTQESLCELTGMSQSNISKILNGKVIPRLETLLKVAEATHTKLTISFENVEGED